MAAVAATLSTNAERLLSGLVRVGVLRPDRVG